VGLSSLLTEHPFGDDEMLLHTFTASYSAGEVRRAASHLAQRLTQGGVDPGQPVAVREADPMAALSAMFGVWLTGGVYVPVNPRSPESEFARTIADIAPAAVLDRGVCNVRGGASTHDPDVAFVTWTSGTSGTPKPILHTHSGYLELLDRVLRPLSGSRNTQKRPSPNLIPVSLALNAGIYNALFGLRAGADLVIMERFDTTHFAELVRRFEIRSTVLPPAAITMLADDAELTGLAPLRYVRSITAPLSPLQARRFTDRFGAFVLNSYGQAEVGEVIGWTAADAKAHPEKLGAAGRPHAGVGIRVVDDDEVACAADVVGHLRVRPPRMAAGYASGDRLTDRMDVDGFLDTGDLARVDPDGFVWIEGRVGDVINRGGHKVYPDQVEEVIRLAPGVSDAAVVGVADDRLGEVPVAFVVADAPIDAHELDALCRVHLVPYKVPAAFIAIDQLPRNETGKLLRAQLAAGYHPPVVLQEGSGR
jgi:long-chain acyl-CoA synthetase